MQVKNVSVTNLGMLSDLRLDDCGALNVLIGPNATGKSTVLQLLDSLLESDRLSLHPDSAFRATASEAIKVECGISLNKADIETSVSDLANDHGRPPPEDAIIREFERVLKAVELRYRYSGVAPRSGTREEGKQTLVGDRPFNEYIQTTLPGHAQNLGRTGVHVTNLEPYFRPMISNKVVYLSVTRRIPPSFGAGRAQKGRPEEIGNWVMQTRGAKLPILEKYEGFLNNVMPHVKAVLIETRQNDFRLGLSENELPGMSPTANWSSGTSHLAIFLGAMAALPPGSIILAEEPELSLHPAAIRQLMEEIRGLADANQVQFFLTTHSDIVVERLDPHSKSHALWRFDRNSDGSASATRCRTEKEIDEAISSLRVR